MSITFELEVGSEAEPRRCCDKFADSIQVVESPECQATGARCAGSGRGVDQTTRGPRRLGFPIPFAERGQASRIRASQHHGKIQPLVDACNEHSPEVLLEHLKGRPRTSEESVGVKSSLGVPALLVRQSA